MAFNQAFDLFAFLNTLSKRDFSAYDRLSDEAQKVAAPFVTQRWMTGTSDVAQIMRVNTFVNPYIFSLGSDKALLFKLLAAAATSKSSRYTWLKGPGAKSEKHRLEVIKQFYEVSTREASSYIIDRESIIEMATELGWDDEELKKLKAEVVKDESGIAEKSGRKPSKR